MTNGTLAISFNATVGIAAVSGIQVIPKTIAPTPVPTPTLTTPQTHYLDQLAAGRAP